MRTAELRSTGRLCVKNGISCVLQITYQSMRFVYITVPAEVICHAGAASLYSSGQRAASEMVMDATQYSPNRPVRIRNVLKGCKNCGTLSFTADEALALTVDCRLTRNAYRQIRNAAMKKKSELQPSYDKVLEAKKRCQPDGIEIHDYGEALIDTDTPDNVLAQEVVRKVLPYLQGLRLVF